MQDSKETSRIGLDIFNQSDNIPSAPTNGANNTGILGWLTNVTNIIQNATSSIETTLENDIESALNNTFESFARDLGLHDFYSFHVQDYCEGYYAPQGSSTRNVTHCGNNNGLKPFNLTQKLEQELTSKTGLNITLEEINWPQSITDGFAAIRKGLIAVYVLYDITIAFTAAALAVSLVGLFSHNRGLTVVNNVMIWFAAVISLIVSALVTTAITKGTNAINDNDEARAINVTASRGDKFLGLTWPATILLWIAGLVWVYECVVDRRHVKKIPKEYQ